MDDGSESKKVKDTKKFVINKKFKFENYENCSEVTEPEDLIFHLEKNCHR